MNTKTRLVGMVALLLVASPSIASAWQPVDPAMLGIGDLDVRPPIRITGDAAFTAENGVVRGAGSLEDPYVIEGWTILAPGTSGIWIEDTTAAVTIRENTVLGAFFANDYSAGIRIERAQDIRIVHNQVSDSQFGVHAREARGVHIQENTIRGVQAPKGLVFSAVSNGGIQILDSTDVSVLGNTVDRVGWGISVQGPSSHVVISENTVRDIWWTQAISLLGGPDHVTITENHIHESPVGIGMSGVAHAYVADNSVEAAGLGMIIISDGFASPPTEAEYLTVENNALIDGGFGLVIEQCANCFVRGNVIARNEQGLRLIGEADTSIEHNMIHDNDVGVHLLSGSWSLSNNSLVDNPTQVRLWGDLDVRRNWWGHAGGPTTDAFEHRGGTHLILYDPWLEQPPHVDA